MTPLFVAGLGRSGTTALWRVLVAHPQVVLGLERYKALWHDRIAEITADRLTRERFLDFTDEATNHTPQRRPEMAEHYAEMARRFDDARYVGDKMTAVRARAMWPQLPEALFVFIVRRPEPLAHSWQRRAEDPADRGWPARNDAIAAARAWNDSLRRTLAACRARPEQTVVVEYERFFGDGSAAALDGVLGFLGLDRVPAVDAEFADVHRAYVNRIAERDRTLPPSVQEHLAATVDESLWRRAVRRAV